MGVQRLWSSRCCQNWLQFFCFGFPAYKCTWRWQFSIRKSPTISIKSLLVDSSSPVDFRLNPETNLSEMNSSLTWDIFGESEVNESVFSIGSGEGIDWVNDSDVWWVSLVRLNYLSISFLKSSTVLSDWPRSSFFHWFITHSDFFENWLNFKI